MFGANYTRNYYGADVVIQADDYSPAVGSVGDCIAMSISVNTLNSNEASRNVSMPLCRNLIVYWPYSDMRPHGGTHSFDSRSSCRSTFVRCGAFWCWWLLWWRLLLLLCFSLSPVMIVVVVLVLVVVMVVDLSILRGAPILLSTRWGGRQPL